MTDTRIVHLALSPKAARLLSSCINIGLDESWDHGEPVRILEAIQKDINEQLPKKKRAKKRASKATR